MDEGQARRLPLVPQKNLSRPACFKMPFAVCFDLILLSTGKRRFVIGLYQIS
jgi:hypothetical protein